MRIWNVQPKATFLPVVCVSLFALGVTACVTKPTPMPPAPVPTAVPATATPAPAISPEAKSAAQPTSPAIDPRSLWQGSKHASTFVADKEGKNNECARCHAPMNWMPTALEDIPAACQTCKFNVRPPKPVAKGDWRNVDCEQCHKTEKGVVSQQVAWLNAAIAQFDTNADPYEAVKSSSELCEKCHRDAFKIEVGKNVHAALSCTDCHNVHSTAASCMDGKCHAGVLKPGQPIAGHDAAHAPVACTACHDAAGLKVGPTDDRSQWVVFRTIDLGGKQMTTPYASHNLKRSVDCARCHFSGNPWGLSKY